jgi:energy-coupling factor transporter ATP-binding protein EcfA2
MVMSIWDSYPSHYRQAEVQAIMAAVQAGECVSVVGLSGAGKSNLLGFLVHRMGAPRSLLVDCNRLSQVTPDGLFHQVRSQLGDVNRAVDEFAALEAALGQAMVQSPPGVCLVFDRFDAFAGPAGGALFNNLRVLRDHFKYQLTLVVATRRPLPADNELAELFFAHTLWLGALSEEDARWSASLYASRHNLVWNDAVLNKIITLSGGYPAFLRAVGEAYAAGAPLELADLLASAPVQARLAEFWSDQPGEEDLRRFGLAHIPLLQGRRTPLPVEISLTAKEQRLLDALRAHPNCLCEKDDLIRTVWPEDRIIMEGVRDDSLAQLVRRLREKIETDPSNPRHVRTVPGRGYIYHE